MFKRKQDLSAGDIFEYFLVQLFMGQLDYKSISIFYGFN